MRSVPLAEVMQTKVVFANDYDTVASVEEKIRLHRIRHIPVVNDEQKPVGMITYRDLLSCARPSRNEEGWVIDPSILNQYILKYIMTPNPITILQSGTVAQVVEIMAREKFGCVPVVTSEGRLVGIVTQIDILKWLSKKFAEGAFL